jgi:hypothetical protein
LEQQMMYGTLQQIDEDNEPVLAALKGFYPRNPQHGVAFGIDTGDNLTIVRVQGVVSTMSHEPPTRIFRADDGRRFRLVEDGGDQ